MMSVEQHIFVEMTSQRQSSKSPKQTSLGETSTALKQHPDGTGNICKDLILCNSPKVNRLIDQSATSVGWHWHWEIWKSSRRKLTLTLRSLPWLRSTGALRLVGHPQTLGVLLAVACFFKQRGPGRKLSFGYFNSTIFNSLVLLGSFPKFWRAQETNTTAPKSGKSDYCRALSAINRE